MASNNSAHYESDINKNCMIIYTNKDISRIYFFLLLKIEIISNNKRIKIVFKIV
jgi:hypothetical protein